MGSHSLRGPKGSAAVGGGHAEEAVAAALFHDLALENGSDDDASGGDGGAEGDKSQELHLGRVRRLGPT